MKLVRLPDGTSATDGDNSVTLNAVWVNPEHVRAVSSCVHVRFDTFATMRVEVECTEVNYYLDERVEWDEGLSDEEAAARADSAAVALGGRIVALLLTDTIDT